MRCDCGNFCGDRAGRAGHGDAGSGCWAVGIGPASIATGPRSGAFDEGVHDLLVAGLLEVDGELVVLDGAYRAIAEFLVEDAVAHREPADPADFLPAPG